MDVPLAASFMLSAKVGKEAYVDPVIERDGYRFTVNVGQASDATKAKSGTKLSRGANFQCIMSGTPITGNYIKAEARAGRMGARLMAVVADGDRGRIYLPPTAEQEAAAREARPEWKPDVEFFQQALGFRIGNYGMTQWSDLFTSRQLVALATLSDLVSESREYIRRHAVAAGMPDDQMPLHEHGMGATAYAEAVSVYLAFALSKQADLGNSLCGWEPIAQCPRHLFGRQAIPMLWDFAEGNPLGESSGAWTVFIDGIGNTVHRATADRLSWNLIFRKGLSTRIDAIAQSAVERVQSLRRYLWADCECWKASRSSVRTSSIR